MAKTKTDGKIFVGLARRKSAVKEVMRVCLIPKTGKSIYLARYVPEIAIANKKTLGSNWERDVIHDPPVKEITLHNVTYELFPFSAHSITIFQKSMR